MSKGQLSFEEMMNGASAAEPSASAPADSTPAQNAAVPSADTAASEASAPEKKKRTRAKSAAEPKAALSDLYQKESWAKKDWSKLETKTVAVTAEKSVTSATDKITEKIEVVSRTVKIPVVKSPPPAQDYDEVEEPAAQQTETKVMSVSDLNKNIREILEGRFPLIWLKAEISNFKAHTSGHFYFSLKDSKAQISAVMFRGYNGQLKFRPEDGMEVLVRGKVTVYEPRGGYQMFCETMEPVGAGALQKAFEQLKAKLQKEGLFDASRKRPLPALPKHIAIVTSPTGAAIRDMLNVLARRFKGANITVIPAKVQGDQAPMEIVNAIRMANKLKDVDVMIVGRGGGSIEDLWAFNDERVVREIAAARVPVISAVGHEIDFTIADFVADLRAPTPSAAAELVVQNAADLAERVHGLSRAAALAMARLVASRKIDVLGFSRRLVDPQRGIQNSIQRNDELLQRLESNMLRFITDHRFGLDQHDPRMRLGIRHALVRKREALAKNMAVLDSLSPLKVLDRGFSMVVKNGAVITDAEKLKTGDLISVRMGKGSVEAEVKKVKEE